MEDLLKKMESNASFFIDQMNAAQNLFAGFVKYNNEFITPYLVSIEYLITYRNMSILCDI